MIEYKIGDCQEMIKELSNVDLIFTDPPFMFKGGAKGGGIVGNRDYIDNIEASFGTKFNPYNYLDVFSSVCSPFNAYFYCSNSQIPIYIDWAEKHKYKWDILCWHKPNPIPAFGGHYLPDTEYLIYIKETGAYFNRDLPFDNYRKWFIAEPPKNIGHPSPKPVESAKRFIEVSCPKQGTVLDPFLGSGTTLMACKQLDINGIGFEINPEYEPIIRKRIMADIPKDIFSFTEKEKAIA